MLSGDLELVDVGVFEVSRDGRETRVLVSDGVIVADPDGAGSSWAGQRLDTEDGATVLQATAGRHLGRILRTRPAQLSR